MEKFNLAVIQTDTQNCIEENCREIERLVKEAAEKGADFALFPETVEYIGPDIPGHGRSEELGLCPFFTKLAKKYHLYIHCGSLTIERMGKQPTNTSYVFSPEGRILGQYSKLHMFDIDLDEGPSYRESDQISAGDEIVLVKTKLGMLGLSICYDMRFGEIYRLMAMEGAEIFLVSANFTMNTGKDHWETLLRARAIENTCYVAAAGQIGSKPSYQAYGKSMIIDPWGNVIAQSSDRPGVIMAEIDPKLLGDIRRQIPSLQNVRNDIYTLESQKIRIYEE